MTRIRVIARPLIDDESDPDHVRDSYIGLEFQVARIQDADSSLAKLFPDGVYEIRFQDVIDALKSHNPAASVYLRRKYRVIRQLADKHGKDIHLPFLPSACEVIP